MPLEAVLLPRHSLENRMPGNTELGQRIREQAATEIRAAEPTFMPVENLSNFLLWRGALLGEAVKLAFKTPGAIVEHLDDQLVLAGKVANIVILATSASAMDPVDSGGMEACALEQRVGRFDDVLTLVGSRR
nr:hypothetical protein [Mesorhizobium sp. Root695]